MSYSIINNFPLSLQILLSKESLIHLPNLNGFYKPYHLIHRLRCSIMEFDNLLIKNMRLLRAKKKLASLVYIKKEGQKIENLVEIYDNKTHISSIPNRLLTSLFMPTHQPLIFLVITLFQFSDTDYWPVNKKVDQFTKMMKGLALFVRTLQNNLANVTENFRLQPLLTLFSGFF